MAEKKLRKGMMVQFTNASIHEECPQWYPEVGTVGTILSIVDDRDVVWVQWPRGSTSMYDRWATPASALEVIPASKNRIVIYADQDTPRWIIAKDIATGKMGLAKCNPEDKFDFLTGAKLAFNRLVDGLEKNKGEEEKLWNGRVVCTYSFRGCDFIVGKIYKVEDGQIVGENGRKFPSCWTTSDHQHNRLRNAGELDKLEDLFGMKSKFIEYKGEN